MSLSRLTLRTSIIITAPPLPPSLRPLFRFYQTHCLTGLLCLRLCIVWDQSLVSVLSQYTHHRNSWTRSEALGAAHDPQATSLYTPPSALFSTAALPHDDDGAVEAAKCRYEHSSSWQLPFNSNGQIIPFGLAVLKWNPVERGGGKGAAVQLCLKYRSTGSFGSPGLCLLEIIQGKVNSSFQIAAKYSKPFP